MENVYVLVDGEDYQGYTIVGIYTSLLRATEVAEDLMAERTESGFNYRRGGALSGSNVEMRWVAGADYIEIQRRTLEN